MDNRQWEELIPFYVARVLTPQEAAAFEKHLRGCESCRRSLAEWEQIASAVRTEAASQLRDLPPLSPAVLRAISSGQPAGAAYPLHTQPFPPPRSRTLRIAVPLTLAAAAAMVLIFAVLLSTLRGVTPPDQIQLGAAQTATETPAPPTATVDLMATIAALSTRYADGTRQSPDLGLQTPVALPFATNTPSLTPERPTHTPPSPGGTVSDASPTPDPDAPPIAIVIGESINLRSGPSTDYPVVGSAEREERLPIVARAGSGATAWLLVEVGTNRTAWVFTGIVQITPPDAVIPVTTNIPPLPATPTPQPTETPAPSPTPSSYVRGGDWTHVTTVVEHQCGGELGVSTTTSLFLVPLPDLSAISITYASTGISFTVFRTGDTSYSGSYAVPHPEGGTASITVQITFENNGMNYTGQETVLNPGSCLVRSLWAGRAMN